MTSAIRFLTLIKKTIHESKKDRIHHWAAALAYYAVFSLVPLLLFSAAIAGLFIPGPTTASLVQEIRVLIGPSAAEVITSLVANLEQLAPNRISLTAIISALVLAIGASSVFRQLHHALNEIWDIATPKRRRIFSFLMRNFLAILMVFLSGIFLAGSILITTAVVSVGGTLRSWIALPLEGWEIANSIASIGILMLLFALLYKLMPDRPIQWKMVWSGALVAAALVTLGKFAFGLYLSFVNFNTAFGTTSSLIVFLVWIHYSALIFFFGAEVTKISHDFNAKN